MNQNEALRELTQAGHAAGQQCTGPCRSAEPTKQAALKIASQLLQVVQTGVDRSPALRLRHCKSGCGLCCVYRVEISPLEAIAVAEYIRAHHTAEEVAAIKARLTEKDQAIRRLTREEHQVAKIRCALLGDDDRCTVYEARPIECRAHNSLSLAECEKGYENPRRDDLNIPLDVYAKTWAYAVVDGCKPNLFAARLDQTPYELHSAVLRALESENAGGRWLDGQDIFKGCNTDHAVRKHLIPVQQPGATTGRNDLCPCGSGRKFKHCCLRRRR